MRRTYFILAMAAALILLSGQSSADFYVISGSAGLGTRINSLPYPILQPGFYYLAGNLNAPAPGQGITISANNVTLDLMGFSLTGTDQSYEGIKITAISNVEIRNGTIQNFGTAISASGNSHRIYNIRALENHDGIYVLGEGGHVVKNCTASKNGDVGIYATNSLLINNVAIGNASNIMGSDNTPIGNHAVP